MDDEEIMEEDRIDVSAMPIFFKEWLEMLSHDQRDLMDEWLDQSTDVANVCGAIISAMWD